VRTYSHAILTFAAARLAKSASRKKLFLAALGATIPDAPAALGAAWLRTRRKTFSRRDFEAEVCGRRRFRGPDAALHSALVAAIALLAERGVRGESSAFTLGWAGHVLTDLLTHGSDARPFLWPVSERRFESPVSYREKERCGRTFTAVEHGAAFAALLLLVAARGSGD
jgi:membrane-bound metal-dependent hydrolase YbcI (DUF457 family)